jgi:microcystin-dependent protein
MTRRMLVVFAMLAGFSVPAHAQVTPYLGQIMEVGFNFCPKGFAATDGQILPINQNQALFSLLGTSYGGDGIRTFALPHLVPPLTVTRQPTTLCIALQGVYPTQN